MRINNVNEIKRVNCTRCGADLTHTRGGFHDCPMPAISLAPRPMTPKPKPVPVKKVKKGLKPKPSAPDDVSYFNRTAFFQERGGMCECGECQDVGGDAHHCMIGRQKKYPILDMKYNRSNVNHFEHTSLKKFDNITWRRFFYLKNCERYGRDKMMDYLRSLPLKIKNTRLDFLTQEEKKEVM